MRLLDVGVAGKGPYHVRTVNVQISLRSYGNFKVLNLSVFGLARIQIWYMQKGKTKIILREYAG